jgi:hypothetical protein
LRRGQAWPYPHGLSGDATQPFSVSFLTSGHWPLFSAAGRLLPKEAITVKSARMGGNDNQRFLGFPTISIVKPKDGKQMRHYPLA